MVASSMGFCDLSGNLK